MSETSFKLPRPHKTNTVKVQAEIDVINSGWRPEADRRIEADSIGLMVYEGRIICSKRNEY